jgi:dinuclear metal center YbgI/SA1388 family protein
MAKVSEIIQKIENLAPLSLASDWDNSGWQIFLGDRQITKVMVALSPTIDVIKQAIAEQCELIIAHHPLIFNKINKINISDQANLTLIKAIQNNIQIYSAHTNLDITQGGIADRLAGLFNLKNIEVSETFARIGHLEKEENLDEFLEKVKNVLNVDRLKLINPISKTSVRKIAVCPGSGGDLIDKLQDVDLYITADIKYHTALEVNNMVVVDAGHLETERIILPYLKELIGTPDIEVFIAEEKSPWKII